MSDDRNPGRDAERGREIIAQVRELEAEDKARYEAFAATIKSPNKKHVHRRDPAAAMVSAAIGAPYSGELLRRSDCPFVVICSDRLLRRGRSSRLSRIHPRQRRSSPRHARQAPPRRLKKPETADGGSSWLQACF